MHEIFLLGDSISHYYEKDVRRILGKDYHVMSTEENCRFAAYTLNSLRFWLTPDMHPEIIHWNNGLWDIATLYPQDGCFTPLDVYMDQLRKILRVLKSTGAKVIFATTTPVHPKKEMLTSALPPCFHYSDIVRYNYAAVEYMKSQNVIIDDLFSIIDGRAEELIREDDLTHPNAKGIQLLAEKVAGCIRACTENTDREE